MLFRGQQNMQKGIAIFPRFLKDLFQSEDLVRGAATWAKTALSPLEFFSPRTAPLEFFRLPPRPSLPPLALRSNY